MLALRLARLLLVAGFVLVAPVAMSLGFAGSADAAGAIVIHPADFPDCQFDPGDVPGVDVAFPATCTVIITPSGNVQLIAHGQLPAGYSVPRTVRSEVPCIFGDAVGTGQVVATKSGRVNATCHFTV